MKITNKLGLPSAFVNIANEQREVKPNYYSVTEILKPTRLILLERRYDDIEQDVSDMIWLIWGTAVHHILEQADKENITEYRFIQLIKDDYYLTGQVDLYNNETFTIEDYKTATVWKIMFEDFEDWRKQLLMYAWLMIANGYHVERIKVHALLKDWSASKAKRDKNYPQQAIYTYELAVTSALLKEICTFIYEKFDELIKYEIVNDDELLECTPEERWAGLTKWGLMKEGRKSAIKLYDEKPDFALAKGEYIEERKGEDRRCIDYCLVKEKCKYWRENYGTTNLNNW